MMQRVARTAKGFQRATRLDLVGAVWLAVAVGVIGGAFLVLSAAWALGTMVAATISVTAVLLARTQPADRAEAASRHGRLVARLHDLALAERAKPLTFPA